MVRFSFEDDWLSVETFVQEDFVWEVLEASIAKNESIVNIADVFDEKVMV